MLNFITSRKSVGSCIVRPEWGDKEDTVKRLLTWEWKRIDEVILSDFQMRDIGMTPPRFGAILVQEAPMRSWLRYMSSVEILAMLSEAPIKLGFARTEEFDQFQTWLLRLSLGTGRDFATRWEVVSCGEHFHLKEVDLASGETLQLDFSIYGDRISEYLSEDELGGLNESMDDNSIEGDLSLFAEVLEVMLADDEAGWNEFFEGTEGEGDENDEVSF